jgi:hypothetical protein
MMGGRQDGIAAVSDYDDAPPQQASVLSPFFHPSVFERHACLKIWRPEALPGQCSECMRRGEQDKSKERWKLHRARILVDMDKCVFPRPTHHDPNLPTSESPARVWSARVYRGQQHRTCAHCVPMRENAQCIKCLFRRMAKSPPLYRLPSSMVSSLSTAH